MIPKAIHYCWFGGAEPEYVQACVRSWQENLAGYTVTRWSEANFDVRSNPHAARWYDAKLYAFVADYARVSILHEHGGIYVDADIEVLPGRSFDGLLGHEAFVGFQYPWPDLEGPDSIANRIGNCVMGSAPRSRFARDLRQRFIEAPDDARMDPRSSDFVLPVDYTRELLTSYGVTDYGLQTVNGVHLLPKDYFLIGIPDRGSAKSRMTDRSICMHHGALSWEPVLLEHRKPLWFRTLRSVGRVLGLAGEPAK